MRILVFAKAQRLRHFDSVLLELARNGHDVIVVLRKKEELSPRLRLNRRIHRIEPEPSRGARTSRALTLMRLTRDYIRYLEPALEGATIYRQRALTKLLETLSSETRVPDPLWPDPIVRPSDVELANLKSAITRIESLVPADPGVREMIQRQRADAILVTPLVALGARQTEIVKAAKELGVPCGVLVFSWDNLSNKGSIQVQPDRVFVWNELQRREAIELHDIQPDSIIVTGASRFDTFFEMKPATTRPRFCRKYDFDPSRPIILYLGSSKTISPDETLVFDAWLRHLRAGATTLRDANVLVRPHPTVRDSTPWQDWRQNLPPGVGMSEAESLQGDRSLYDELYHSVAAVALNTSAEIEASILAKPVFTFEAGDEHAPGQRGSLHFYYLLKEHGGVVQHAKTLEEHVEQLEGALARDVDAAAIQQWVETFIRPHGIDRPATPILVDAITALAKPPDVSPASPIPARRTPWRSKRETRRMAVEMARRVAPRLAARRRRTETAVVDYERHRLSILVSSSLERRWRVKARKKEPWTVAWLEQEVRPGDTVYDIGANVGVFSLIAASLLQGDGLVAAFEPSFANYARLCENIAFNKFSGLVVPVPNALSSTSGIQAFTYRSLEPGESRHSFAAQEWNSQARGSSNGRFTQAMPAITLDEAVAVFGLPLPNIVKLDVDGAELHVLEGAARTFAHEGFRSLLIEVDPEVSDAVVALLESWGLSLRETHKRKEHARVWYGVFGR